LRICVWVGWPSRGRIGPPCRKTELPYDGIIWYRRSGSLHFIQGKLTDMRFEPSGILSQDFLEGDFPSFLMLLNSRVWMSYNETNYLGIEIDKPPCTKTICPLNH
jgi:hypothetical protein